jgi:hypothetical protein
MVAEKQGKQFLVVSSLTIFGSAGEKALQGHTTCLAILHQEFKRAIFLRVKETTPHMRLMN